MPAPHGNGGSRHRWNPEANAAICRAWPKEKDVFGRYYLCIQTSQT